MDRLGPHECSQRGARGVDMREPSTSEGHVMDAYGGNSILVAEVTIADARNVVRCLKPLNVQVYPATTVEQVFERMRHRVFAEAIVAAELTFDGELLLSYLYRQLGLTSIVAVGPSGDPEAEARARAAGAKMYLGRPVTTEVLAAALGTPPSEAVSVSV